MVHKCLMLDILWPALLGGVLIGALTLLVSGLPLLFLEQRHLRELYRRQEELEVAVVRETKRRASQEGVRARTKDAELDLEASRLLAVVPGPTSGPRLLGRKS